MTNYHAIQVTPIGATDTQPSRVKIKSLRFKQSVTIPYSNEPGEGDPLAATAEKYLKSKGITLIGKGEDNNGFIMFSEVFEPIK